MKLRMLSLAVVLVVSSVLCGNASADWPGVHTRNMANAGSLWHDGSVGHENVYMDGGPLIGAKWRATKAWLKSSGHRDNLPVVVKRARRVPGGGVAVTGRKLFGR
jgi:hypothetical protein